MVRGIPFAALLTVGILVLTGRLHAQHEHEHAMSLDSDGMLMNGNPATLPRDCQEVSREYEFDVHAGTDYAAGIPGTIYGFSQHEFVAEPCSRISVTLINEDKVRHQWMVHGLPKYLYPQGMFHIEAAGGRTRTGTFIVPSDHRTYLVHCDVAQHMEKGMKAQLKVGGGNGDLWAIPTISRDFNRVPYLPESTPWLVLLATAVGVASTTLILARRQNQSLKGAFRPE